MIIWINCSFGVGKTTVAEMLKNKINDAVVYDPEEVGYFLQKILPKIEDDFQDNELWRKLNYEILKYLNNNYKKIIVPMTITNSGYYEEIVGKLQKDGIKIKEFILMATKENLIKRLDKRGNSTEWSYQQIDRCIGCFNSNFNGQKISTDDNNIDSVVTKILSLLN